MSKKDRFKREEAEQPAVQPAAQPLSEEETSPQAESADGTDNLVTQKPLVAEPVAAAADFCWDCGDTRYNIGDKVFRHGARLTGIPVDDDGSPKDAALKAAYRHKFLKTAEKTNPENKE